MALMIGSSALHANEYSLSPIEELGEAIFHDTNLSINKNQGCVSCHDPKKGWSAGISEFNIDGTVHEGSIKRAFGNRKPPSSAYATLSPRFYADFGKRLIGEVNPNLADSPRFIGGNFWDGRATGWKLGNSAADQSQGPFLNPVEHALPNPACVVQRVCKSSYVELFDTVWSPKICSNVETKLLVDFCEVDDFGSYPPPMQNLVSQAYDRVALSIAAFEGSKASNAYTSKVDAFRAGMASFTDQEERGRIIFRDEAKCVSCHTGAKGPGGAHPLLTDFSYSNIGTPPNPENPSSEIDLGLGGFLETVPGYADYADDNMGKMKVPTLRNVALGSCEDAKNMGQQKKCINKTYMHNGYFKSLKSVVHFYNTRDSKDVCEDIGIIDATEEVALANNCWPKPEVDKNVETNIMGGLEVELTEEDEDALVAFMQAMSDGYFERED